MSVQPTAIEIDYPESDGKPMGETDLHRYWMSRIIDLLSYRYRDQRVYVSGDLLVFYEEGTSHKFVAPDALVAKDCEPGFRRIFKCWEEGKCPDVLFEVTSRSTQREDTVIKLPLYERIGVRELLLYDPTGDYLKPPLVGYRLGDDGFERVEPDANGALASEQLGVRLQLEDRRLVMCDAETGRKLQTRAEAAEMRAEAAETRAEAAETRTAQESAARKALEVEIERLREQLERTGGSE